MLHLRSRKITFLEKVSTEETLFCIAEPKPNLKPQIFRELSLLYNGQRKLKWAGS